MKIESELLEEVRLYLQKLLEIHDRVPLDFTWRAGGANASRILYHTGQSAKFWLSDVIMNKPTGRNRAEEFERDHTIEDIRASLEQALQLTDELTDSGLDLEQPVSFHGQHKPTLGLKNWNVAKALIHVAAHTADHYGQMKIALRQD